MTTKKTPGVQHPITQDVPLPGFYPCLTLQLNVTRYASGRLGRFVLVLREPSDGVEISRTFIDSSAWQDVANAVPVAMGQALVNMAYLQDARND
jgi:hypothetical protein